jgi:hypothetical protein
MLDDCVALGDVADVAAPHTFHGHVDVVEDQRFRVQNGLPILLNVSLGFWILVDFVGKI